MEVPAHARDGPLLTRAPLRSLSPVLGGPMRECDETDAGIEPGASYRHCRAAATGHCPRGGNCELVRLRGCRALVGEQGEPGLLDTPEVSERFGQPITRALLKAGLQVSKEPYAWLPQVRAWATIMRNPAIAGVLCGWHVVSESSASAATEGVARRAT